MLTARSGAGQVSFDGYCLKIRRRGIRPALMGHGRSGDRDIPLERLTGIDLVPASPVRRGYLSLRYAGQDEGRPTRAYRDPDTVTFSRRRQASMQALCDAVLKARPDLA